MSGNTKDFKVKAGIQPTSYYEGVGTVVSGSEGYYLAGASYDSVSFSVASQDTSPQSLAFNTNGTKMYVVGLVNKNVYQYSLSEAYDITTASYDSVSFNVSSQDTLPRDVIFNSGGTKMYIVGSSSDNIHQYSLSTAFDLSTASYDSVSLDVGSQDANPLGIAFNNNGTKMYMVGFGGDAAYQYSLSTAFDLSTASYDSVSFSVASQEISPSDIAFNTDGTNMYVVGFDSDTVYQYSLSTAFDLSTASYDSVSFSVLSQEGGPTGLSFKPDGTKVYVVGTDNNTVYQYSTAQTTAELDLSTGSVFEITPTSDIQVTLSNPAASGTVSQATLLLDGAAASSYDLGNAAYDSVSFSVASQDDNPFDISFNNDGTKMYMVGITSDTVYQYTLSTAFDLSTASYDSVSFSVAAQDIAPLGIAFNSDGTKMYIAGAVSDSVYQYSLSTSFDLSTASYDSVSFSVASQDATPYGIAFNNDGTNLYMVGLSNDSVYQYSLSTSFDLSTASYDSVSFSVASQDATPRNITFNNDGTKLYMVGSDVSDSVHQYSLSTAFDLSTASYDSVSFSVAGQDNSPVDVTFNNDGTKLYILGNSTDTIYQYSTATPATITYDSALQWSGGTAPTSPAIGETDVITFNTTDGGTTYQAVQAIDGAK